MRFQNQSKGDVEKMSIHYETCARCDKDLVITMSDDYYFSDIDGKVLCKECYEKEQPKELIKQISDLQLQLAEKEKEQNQKAIEQLEKVKNKIESKVESIYKILDDLSIKIVGESTSRELNAYEEIAKDIDNQIKQLKEEK